MLGVKRKRLSTSLVDSGISRAGLLTSDFDCERLISAIFSGSCYKEGKYIF